VNARPDAATIDRATACPVCSSEERRALFSDRNRRDGLNCIGTYVQCMTCTHIYLSNPPPPHELIKFYSTVHLHTEADAARQGAPHARNGALRPHRWKSWLRRIRVRPHSWPSAPAPPEGKRLLDLGCGDGVKLIEFAQRGYEVWGVDVSSGAIAEWRRALPEGHFMQSELHETALPEGYFNYVRIDNALEHVCDPRSTLRECRRVLSPGGAVLVYVPHGQSLSIRLMNGGSISSWIPFHVQLFTHDSLSRLLREAGFDSVEIHGYSPLHWLPLSIAQLLGVGNDRFARRLVSLLLPLCAPIGWLATKIGMAEELVGVGRKPPATQALG